MAITVPFHDHHSLYSDYPYGLSAQVSQAARHALAASYSVAQSEISASVGEVGEAGRRGWKS